MQFQNLKVPVGARDILLDMGSNLEKVAVQVAAQIGLIGLRRPVDPT
jgi:hypothetical protein